MLQWRRQANEFATSRLDRQMEEPAMSRNAVLCDQTAGQGNDFDGPTSRDFSSIYTVRELSPDEVRSPS